MNTMVNLTPSFTSNPLCPLPAFNISGQLYVNRCLNQISLTLKNRELFKGGLTHWIKDLKTACDLNSTHIYEAVPPFCQRNITKATEDLCLNNHTITVQSIFQACTAEPAPTIPYLKIIAIGTLVVAGGILILCLTNQSLNKRRKEEERELIKKLQS